MTRPVQSGALLTAASLLAMGLSGCSALGIYYLDESKVLLDDSMLPGTWHVEGPSGEVGSLVLRSDGTARAESLPASLCEPTASSPAANEVSWEVLLDGEGGWFPAEREAGGGSSVATVGLYRDGEASCTFPLLAIEGVGDPDDPERGQEGDVVMFTVLGDFESGNRFYFEPRSR